MYERIEMLENHLTEARRRPAVAETSEELHAELDAIT